MQRRREDARAVLYEKIRTSPPRFVHVVGVPYNVERAELAEGAEPDHVWVNMEVPPFGRLRAVINTTSRANREAGVDPRVKVAILPWQWTQKPVPVLSEEIGQDYGKMPGQIDFTPYEQEELAEMLVERGKRAVRVEVWGELFAKDQLGIRQIHCRRGSPGRPLDLRNRDGALSFYYGDDNTADLFLFKFAGQP